MKVRSIVLALFAVMMFSSCSIRKNIVYLNDMEMGKIYPMDTRHEAVIHCDDRLSIKVSCKNPELALPFNLYGETYRVDGDGNIAAGGGSQGKEKGYRVDKDGYIDFPILGRLYVAGSTVGSVTEMIKKLIIEGDYIKDPIVSIEFLNFKYTVLGAVGRNGTFSSDGDNVTILEAIANANDLTSKARIDRVAVIREVGDGRQMFMHDLRSTDIFESPCFYLQQNDIVYVEPKYRKKDGEDRTLQYTSFVISIMTSLTTLFILLFR